MLWLLADTRDGSGPGLLGQGGLATGKLPPEPPARGPRRLGDSRCGVGSEIVITTTSRLAGAIHSLTWNGKEFIGPRRSRKTVAVGEQP